LKKSEADFMVIFENWLLVIRREIHRVIELNLCIKSEGTKPLNKLVEFRIGCVYVKYNSFWELGNGPLMITDSFNQSICDESYLHMACSN
jgi:hypothetical protein